MLLGSDLHLAGCLRRRSIFLNSGGHDAGGGRELRPSRSEEQAIGGVVNGAGSFVFSLN